MQLFCINKIGVSVTLDYCVHSGLVQAYCTYLGACGCTEDTDMGSLCVRLFMIVHGCWQSINSCGMIFAQLLGVVYHSY